MAENLLATLGNSTPDDVQEALRLTGGDPALVGASPPGTVPVAGAPVTGPTFAVPPSPEAAADVALAAALPPSAVSTAPATPVVPANPLDISQRARLNVSPAPISPLPGVGDAPAPGEAAAVPPPDIDGATLFRTELASIRASGLDDDTIREGISKGILPQSLKTALENEEQAVNILATARRKSATEQADVLAAATDAQNIVEQRNELDRGEIDREVQRQIDTLNELREERKGLAITDPWANKSTGQKILAAIAMVIGGAGAGLTGGPNLAVQVINQALERDLKVQLARRRAKGEQIKGQQNLVQILRRRLGDVDRGAAAARVAMYDAVELKIKELTSRQQGRETEGNAAVLLSQIQQKRAELEQQFALTARETSSKQFRERRFRAQANALQKAEGDIQTSAEVLLASGLPESVVQATKLLVSQGKASKGLGKIAQLNAALDANAISPEQHAAAVAKETGQSLDTVAGSIAALLVREKRAPTDVELTALELARQLGPSQSVISSKGIGDVGAIWRRRHGTKQPTITPGELGRLAKSTQAALELRGGQQQPAPLPTINSDAELAGAIKNGTLKSGDRYRTDVDNKIRRVP